MHTHSFETLVHSDTHAHSPVIPAGAIELDQPIKRGGSDITHIVLRKPMAGELRGIKLVELLHLDTGALQTVLPRITTPSLTAAEVAGMDPADFTELGTQVAGFFVRKNIRAEFLTA